MVASLGKDSNIWKPRLPTGNLAKPDQWRDRLPGNMGGAAGALSAHQATIPSTSTLGASPQRPMPAPKGGAMMSRSGSSLPNSMLSQPSGSMGAPRMGATRPTLGMLDPADNARNVRRSVYDMQAPTLEGRNRLTPWLRQVNTTPSQVTPDVTGYTPGYEGATTALEAPPNPMISANRAPPPQEGSRVVTDPVTGKRMTYSPGRGWTEVSAAEPTPTTGTTTLAQTPTLQERAPIQRPAPTPAPTNAAPISPGPAQSQTMTAQEYADASMGSASPEAIQEILDKGWTIDDNGNVYDLRQRADESGILGPLGGMANTISNAGYLGNIYEPEQGDEVTGILERWRRQSAEQQGNEQDAEIERRRQQGLDELRRAQGMQIQGLDPKLLEELLQTQRAQRAQALARSQQSTGFAASRMGLTPDAVAGREAELGWQAGLEGAGQDAQTKYQFALQDMQNRIREYDQQISLSQAIAAMLSGTAEAEQAFRYSQQLAEQRAQQERDMAIFMQQFEPTFAEQALGGLFGVAGTVGGNLASWGLGKELGLIGAPAAGAGWKGVPFAP